jgi:UTP--glucose-1-phosphate uridylyltransferase
MKLGTFNLQKIIENNIFIKENVSMIRKAVVLCGGLATRFLPYCKSVPKEMLPVIDKPVIEYIIDDLVEAGIEEILIVLGRNKECIINHFDKNVELYDRLITTKKWAELERVQRLDRLAKICYIRQIAPRGTGDAILKARTWVGDEPFVMCFGDEMFTKRNVYSDLIDAHHKYGNMVIATMPVAEKLIPLYGIVDKSCEGEYYPIKKFVEKPKIENAPSNIAYCGPAILDKQIFEYITRTPEINLEVSLADAYNLAINDNKLYGLTVNAEKLDLGNKLGFVKANIASAIANEEMRDDIIDIIDEYRRK